MLNCVVTGLGASDASLFPALPGDVAGVVDADFVSGLFPLVGEWREFSNPHQEPALTYEVCTGFTCVHLQVHQLKFDRLWFVRRVQLRFCVC